MSSSPTQKHRRGGGGGRRRKKGNSSSSSSSVIGHNVDLLELILFRVPSKSLLVFKCVSKPWQKIITDPEFVHRYFKQNPNLSVDRLFMSCEVSGKPPKYEYIFPDGNTNSYVPFDTLAFVEGKSLRSGIRILQSCNGLLLCSTCEVYGDRTYYVFNPFTKQSKTLPLSQMRSSSGGLRGFGLAFDPFKSPFYKVIYFWHKNIDEDYFNYKTAIYDSETSSWSEEVHTRTPRTKAMLWGIGVFWNCSLYFRVSGAAIFRFDINRESVDVVTMPSSAPRNDDTTSFDIAEYGGHLYLMLYDNFNSQFTIFEMDSAVSSWNLIGQVDARSNPYAGSPCGSSFAPSRDYIMFIEKENEKEPTKVLLLTKESKVLSYDLKGMSYKRIYDFSAQQKSKFHPKFYPYIESLACIKSVKLE